MDNTLSGSCTDDVHSAIVSQHGDAPPESLGSCIACHWRTSPTVVLCRLVGPGDLNPRMTAPAWCVLCWCWQPSRMGTPSRPTVSPSTLTGSSCRLPSRSSCAGCAGWLRAGSVWVADALQARPFPARLCPAQRVSGRRPVAPGEELVSLYTQGCATGAPAGRSWTPACQRRLACVRHTLSCAAGSSPGLSSWPVEDPVSCGRAGAGGPAGSCAPGRPAAASGPCELSQAAGRLTTPAVAQQLCALAPEPEQCSLQQPCTCLWWPPS